MKKIILLAATVYFLLAPFTYHPDTKLVLYYPTLNEGKVWDIYSYLEKNKDDAPKFHYPPMHYWLLKAELPIVELIGGREIVDWLKIGGNVAFRDQKIFLYNLATKFPLIILVLASGWIIGKILLKNGCKSKTANLAMAIWLLNPITLFSAIMMGQNDILAIFPFLVGLYFYFDHPWLAFVMFGLGGSIKSYPLLWSTILAFNYPKTSWSKKIALALLPIVIYVGTMVPFWQYEYFKQDVLYSGLSIRIFEGAIDIGLGDKLLIVPMLLVSLVLIGVKRNLGRDIAGVTSILTAATLIILGFTHFHPQWFIWLMPFLATMIAVKKEWWWPMFLLPALLGIILLFEDKFLYWGLISPMNPDLINLPFITEMLTSRGINTTLLNNLCHSVVAGLAVYGFFDSINEK